MNKFEIYVDGVKQYEGCNTLTKEGKILYGKILASSKFINGIYISSDTNLGDETTRVDNKDILPVESYSCFIDPVTENIIVKFEGYKSTVAISSIKTIGLCYYSDTEFDIVTVADTSVTTLNTAGNIYLSYEFRIKL